MEIAQGDETELLDQANYFSSLLKISGKYFLPVKSSQRSNITQFLPFLLIDIKYSMFNDYWDIKSHLAHQFGRKKKLSLSSEHDTACYFPDSAFENKVQTFLSILFVTS